MARKTVTIAALLEKGNTALAAPDLSTLPWGDPVADMTPDQAYRAGIASLLERALCLADAYRGYNFQTSELTPARDGLREGYDDTRRRYYGPTS